MFFSWSYKHRESKMLVYLGQFRLFCRAYAHFSAYFLQAQIVRWCTPKLTNIRYALLIKFTRFRDLRNRNTKLEKIVLDFYMRWHL